MLTLIVFLIILGFLVTVHELGHFLVARRNGIKADEFGFGFPPRIFGIVKDEKKNKWIFIRGSKHVESENTIYSLNWFPIGGFVKIKGADTEQQGEDSFISKSAWVRIKVLFAGVAMNVIFAWIFLSLGFMMGTPQEVSDENNPNSSILITSVEDNSPANSMGIIPGDVVSKTQVSPSGEMITLKTSKDLQDFIDANKGREIALEILRGKEVKKLSGAPRASVENGKGLLGIGLAQVETKKYSFFPALIKGFEEMGSVLLMMLFVLKQLFTGTGGVEVSGIIGIAAVTGQVIPMGLSAIMRLVAIFSLNLALINALPFPALDGGRIFFILIEKIKGSPVSQKIEQTVHTIGFLLLMLLMIFVTYRDIIRLDIFEKIKNIF